MKKSFKLTHKPGHALLQTIPLSNASATMTSEERAGGESIIVASLPGSELSGNTGATPRSTLTTSTAIPALPHKGSTTRKTIEVPEEYFYQVKMRALQRRIKEKDLWAEILAAYFAQHPE